MFLVLFSQFITPEALFDYNEKYLIYLTASTLLYELVYGDLNIIAENPFGK